ncbi:tapasin [Spea bombifrons]|uniref:tapasin n=1 Tax=Spea bombifrons TaxID=233779 RepID=UPI002349DE86|nr:tapasin [Spea bombifrons]
MTGFVIYNRCLFSLLGAVLLGTFQATKAGSFSCWFVEEVIKENSPRTIQRTAVQLAMTDLSGLTIEPPVNVEPGTLLYYVTDTSGKLPTAPSTCEMMQLLPQEVPIKWVLSLTEEQLSPQSLGGSWFILSVMDKTDGNTLSVVLGPLGDQKNHLTVSLVVHSPSKTFYAHLGEPASLPCDVWRGPQARFAVEWRHRAEGEGKVLYAYDGYQDRVEEECPSCKMNFTALHSHGDASLLLDNVTVEDQGTFLCTVYLPYVRAQREIQVKVTAVPQVTFLPESPFAPSGEKLTLTCEVSHFHPFEISVEYLVQLPGESHWSLVPGVSLSPHAEKQDGTFSLTAFLDIIASPELHGARYSCRVRHVSTPKGLTSSRTLRVSGLSGLSFEDGMCLFVVALALYGALSLLNWTVKLFRRLEDTKAKSE